MVCKPFRRALACCFSLLIAFPTLISALQQDADAVMIVGATVVDGTGADAYQADVLIRGDRIVAVGRNLDRPARVRIIRADGHTLMPGIFDLHTHLPYATAGDASPDWAKNLKAYLYCGVTSVVDFGTYPETFEPMRRLTSSGVIPSPRLSLAARLATPGGHGAEGGRPDVFTLEVTTPEEARAAVQRILPYRPDVIKVFSDGWRYGAAADMTSMNEDTLTAIVEEAHKADVEVLTHTVTLEKAKIAARAGVDVIAHGIGNAEVDEELIQLMKTQGTSYAPTLAVYEQRGRGFTTPLIEKVLEPAAKAALAEQAANQSSRTANARTSTTLSPQAKRWQYLLRNTAALRQGGIRFGTGTDSGISGTHHGWATLREIKLLVQGGLTPLEALTAATGNSARAIKVDQERGTITAGKLADLVLIEGEPHKNIDDLEKIKRVFLNGRELDRERLARDIADPALTPLPAKKSQGLIDDFESADGRSRLDTLWINNTDSGHDRSKMLFGRTLRSANNHVLSLLGRMASKTRPFVRVNVPLSRGAFEPVDASAFRGVRFDVRGDGDYRLIVPTRSVRNGAYYQATFTAGPAWKTVRVEFTALKQDPREPTAWTGKDLLQLTFEAARKAGEMAWLELDNVRFY